LQSRAHMDTLSTPLLECGSQFPKGRTERIHVRPTLQRAPAGAAESSPARKRWEPGSFAPFRGWTISRPVPALTRWAIFFRPGGLVPMCPRIQLSSNSYVPRPPGGVEAVLGENCSFHREPASNPGPLQAAVLEDWLRRSGGGRARRASAQPGRKDQL